MPRSQQAIHFIPDRQPIHMKPYVEELLGRLFAILQRNYYLEDYVEQDFKINRACCDALYYIVLRHLYRNANFRLSCDLTERFIQCCAFVYLLYGVSEREVDLVIEDGALEELADQIETSLSFIETGDGWDTWEVDVHRYMFIVRRCEDYRIKAFHFFELDRSPDRMVLPVDDSHTLLTDSTRRDQRRG